MPNADASSWDRDRTQWASAHFKWAELACHDAFSTPYPEDYRDDPEKLPKLLAILEAIRHHACMDTSLILNSVFRTLQWNLHCGGAPHSQHPKGTAADVRSATIPVADLFNRIVFLAQTQPALGVRYIKGYGSRDATHPDGARVGWVHVDVGVKAAGKVIVEWED